MVHRQWWCCKRFPLKGRWKDAGWGGAGHDGCAGGGMWRRSRWCGSKKVGESLNKFWLIAGNYQAMALQPKFEILYAEGGKRVVACFLLFFSFVFFWVDLFSFSCFGFLSSGIFPSQISIFLRLFLFLGHIQLDTP